KLKRRLICNLRFGSRRNEEIFSEHRVSIYPEVFQGFEGCLHQALRAAGKVDGFFRFRKIKLRNGLFNSVAIQTAFKPCPVAARLGEVMEHLELSGMFAFQHSQLLMKNYLVFRTAAVEQGDSGLGLID